MIERLLAGEAALAGNDLDAAERLFQQVAHADPRNAIAVAGLARVASRRNDPARARAFAEQALAIDPGEAAASRLIAELERRAVPNLAPEPTAAAVPNLAPEPASPAEPPPARRPASVAPAARGWRAWLARLLRRS